MGSPGDGWDTENVNPDVRRVGMVSTVKGELLPQAESGR